jgi:hypothetical protein
MQTKRGEGNERRRTNLLQELLDHNKNFWEKKIRKGQEQGAAMFGATAPVLP